MSVTIYPKRRSDRWLHHDKRSIRKKWGAVDGGKPVFRRPPEVSGYNPFLGPGFPQFLGNKRRKAYPEVGGGKDDKKVDYKKVLEEATFEGSGCFLLALSVFAGNRG